MWTWELAEAMISEKRIHTDEEQDHVEGNQMNNTSLDDNEDNPWL
jgi:hypothetical protein